MFVGEVTEYWFAQYPWTGPTPSEVAVTVVDRVIALLLAKGELKPGAEHAIALCARRGLSLAVASSSQYRLIDTALDHFGLRHHFALVHSAEDETWGKPHPAVFLTAAAKLGAAARRCLVWEDAPAGVLAAKAASMACIAVPEHGEEHQPAFALADVVLGSLLEMDEVRFEKFCDQPGAASLRGCPRPGGVAAQKPLVLPTRHGSLCPGDHH